MVNIAGMCRVQEIDTRLKSGDTVQDPQINDEGIQVYFLPRNRMWCIGIS